MSGDILHYCVRLLHSPPIVYVTQQTVLVHPAQLLSGVDCVLLRRALNNKQFT